MPKIAPSKPERSGVAVLRPGSLALLAACLAGTAFAQERPAPPRPEAPPRTVPAAKALDAKAPDPAFEAAQAAFEALGESERRAVQDALAWTGHYTSVISASFGRRTFDAILAYQRANRTEASGILGDGPRAALLATMRRARDAAGFALRRDPATGVAIGVPARLLPREQKTAQGTRWQSSDGRVTLETRAFHPGETDLQATFERVSAAAPERKVTYRLRRPDFLVVTGETPTGRFYIRYADTPAGLRGFTLAYDKAMSTEIDRIVIAVANSFDPAPGGPVTAVGPPSAAVFAPPRPSLPPAVTAPSPSRTATGLVVAPGRLLTSAAALANCPSPRVGGEAARRVVAEGEPALALLAFAEGPGVVLAAAPVNIAPAPLPEAELLAISVAPSGAGFVAPGIAGATGRILAPLQPGADGAPAFDRDGRLAGIVERYPTAPRVVAGIVPPASYALVTPVTIAAFLAHNGIATKADTATGSRSTGEIASLFAGRVRRVTCD